MDNKKELILSDFLQGFNQDNMVLYIGQKGESDLCQEIYDLPWKCIVTSVTRNNFGVEFSNDERKCIRITRVSELSSDIFNRNNLPLIQMFGINDDKSEDEDDELFTIAAKKRDATNILSRILFRLDSRSRMIIIGYDPSDDKEYPLYDFVALWDDIRGGSLHFFVEKQELSRIETKLKKEVEKRDFLWNPYSLGEILKENSETINKTLYSNHINTENESLFYKGKQAVTIKNSILLKNRNIAQLLTEESIHEIKPLGRIQQSLWYLNFLQNSVEGPQWYGYLPQSDFYLKRDFEDALVALTRNLLGGRKMAVKGVNTPIILQGDPGSSKSIELAALAYRVYNEKINPVIYIKNDKISFSANSTEFFQLDDLMQEIEKIGETDTRFLILWDSSYYRNISEEASNLARELENVGRRFVLVCTAYRNSKSVKDDRNDNDFIRWYSYSSEAGFNFINGKKGQVLFDGKRYYVSSTRVLTEQEKYKLRQKANLYAVLDKNELTRRWRKLELENNNDIFSYFYQLVNLIRPNLEGGLTKEQISVNKYVRKQLSIIGGEKRKEDEDKKINTLKEALLEAGIIVSDDDILQVSDENEDNQQFDLDVFNTCIAMFSRFKIDAPYGLLIRMLYKGNKEGEGTFFSYSNRQLFELLMNDIPYLLFTEDAEGHHVFKFRNSLEAEIFLDKNEVSPERQIELICSLLDNFATICFQLKDVDIEARNAIINLLKMYGPNSEYVPYIEKTGKAHSEHISILKQLDKITDKLHELRVDKKIPDSERVIVGTEITFNREYYGNLWNRLSNYNDIVYNSIKPWDEQPEYYTIETYEKRLKKLKETSDLALKTIYDIESELRFVKGNREINILSDNRNTLSVELCLCNRKLASIYKEYLELCTIKSYSHPIDRKLVEPLAYLHLFQRLVNAINSSPTDGYAYNALFNLFEDEYESLAGQSEVRLERLSQIRMIADEASTLDITNRGMNDNNEIGRHINKIFSYCSSYDVSIKSLENGNCDQTFLKLFKTMLERNDASSLCFVIQKELDSVGLGGKDILEYKLNNQDELILNEEQLQKCEEIIDFINQDKYQECVFNDHMAIYLMIRVAWMYYNERLLDESREAQITYLNLDQWNELHKLCELYLDCSGVNKKPIVTLLYALSTVQLNLSVATNYNDAAKVIDSINKDAFVTIPRLRVPFLICKEPGVVKEYSGTVISVSDKYNGFIRVDSLPQYIGSKKGIRFHKKNLGVRQMPQKNEVLPKIALGLGYTGFSIYKIPDLGMEV